MAILNNSNAISAGGYDINNSVRLRSSASAYLNRTPASAGNRKTFTWSGWFKKSRISAYSPLFYADAGGNTNIQIQFLDDNTLRLFQQFSGVDNFYLVTTQVFRDPSAWYHVVVAIDTTQATSSNRAKMYVNGVQVTAFSSTLYPTLNLDTTINSTVSHYVGYAPAGPYYFDGYLAEVNFIDGQALTPSSFGETDSTTGSWKPKAYTSTYGTNGFYLKFSDIATTSGSNAGLGKDFSGNANYWTTNNISVTAGTTYDAMIDSPTNTSATVANYAVMNPLSNGGATISNANLTTTANGATHLITNAKFQMPTSGKYYWEITATTLGSTARIATGLLPNGTALTGYPWGNANTYGWYYGDSSNNIYWCSNSAQPFFIAGAVNDVLQICYDADNGTVYAGKNNVFYNSSGSTTGSPSTLTNPTSTGATATNAFFPATSVFTAGAFAINFGQRPFSYTPPTGFVALNTYNLPTPTILQGNKYMDATLYTGNGANRSITNAGAFKPDAIWIKTRSAGAYNHHLVDSVRGANKNLRPNLTGAEDTTTDQVTAINSNGFSLGVDTAGPADSEVNVNGNTYVAWQWQAGQGSTSSNTAGSITSTVSVNTTAGFSVVTFTTPSSGSYTVGHSLGVAPKFVITKYRNSGSNWDVWHGSLGGTQYLNLNTTSAVATNSAIFSSSPTSTLVNFGNNAAGGYNIIMYAWAEIAGYSKAFSYTGNGSTDGSFVYLGFRPKWIMIKGSSAAGNPWYVVDSSRNVYNIAGQLLEANSSAAESTYDFIDFLSNGFKIRNTGSGINGSGATFIGMAFAEHPFASNNRAR